MSWFRTFGFALSATLPLAACSVPPWDDVVEQYAARKDGVTLSAGNAPKTNAAIQTIDPAPSSAFNTQIPANGERMAGAVERYKDVSKLTNAPRQIVPTYGSQGNVGAVGGGSSGSGGFGGINPGAVGVPSGGQ
jgi:hypothetical protein